MIINITTIDEISDFVYTFVGDISFSDPMLRTEEQFAQNLTQALAHPEAHCMIGVYRKGGLTGVFSFLVNAGEGYLEMLVGLSREAAAYEEMLDCLEQKFPSYEVDFVCNPRNDLIRRALEGRGAAFDPEQLRLVWKRTPPAWDDSCTVIPYEERYQEAYIALHRDEGRYWTAEKVIAAADRFRIFLALLQGQVVGYIDVTYPYAENEPYDVFVSEEKRRLGFGKALLGRALAANGFKGMTALVERNDVPAVQLFLSMGFEIDPSGGSVLARLTV